jgi:hypothetical protein
MRRRLRPLIRLLGLTTLLAVFLTNPTSAEAVVGAFGPKEYVRTTGAPNTFTESFAACRPGRAFLLRIENGPRGLPRISSGNITLNGTEVVHGADFNQQVSRIERAVALQTQNTLTVQLASKPGATIAVSIVSETPCLEVTITEPPDGTPVPKTQVRVRGAVQASGEVAVVVNGVLAHVNGHDFVAEAVPLRLGVNTLTAIAIDPEGNTSAATVTVTVPADATQPSLILAASPTSGLAPLSTTFSFSSVLPTRITSVMLDFGDGGSPFTGTSLESVTHTYSGEGLYFPTLTVTDAQGTQTTASTLINVFPLPDLMAKWNGMKAALRRGDIAGALQFIVTSARDRYAEAFTILRDDLANIDAILTDLTFVRIRGREAIFEMRRMDEGIPASFEVRFGIDTDGIWRLRAF